MEKLQRPKHQILELLDNILNSYANLLAQYKSRSASFKGAGEKMDYLEELEEKRKNWGKYRDIAGKPVKGVSLKETPWDYTDDSLTGKPIEMTTAEIQLKEIFAQGRKPNLARLQSMNSLITVRARGEK